jgi:hypothetical protein
MQKFPPMSFETEPPVINKKEQKVLVHLLPGKASTNSTNTIHESMRHREIEAYDSDITSACFCISKHIK